MATLVVPTDEDLDGAVALAGAGDEAAFARIITAHHHDMTRVCFVICGDLDVADEAVQAAWPIVWRKLGSLRDPGRLRPGSYRSLPMKLANSSGVDGAGYDGLDSWEAWLATTDPGSAARHLNPRSVVPNCDGCLEWQDSLAPGDRSERPDWGASCGRSRTSGRSRGTTSGPKD